MAIVQSVAHLARMLEIEVTAEGIETAMQLELLKAAGCGSGWATCCRDHQDGAIAILDHAAPAQRLNSARDEAEQTRRHHQDRRRARGDQRHDAKRPLIDAAVRAGPTRS